MRAEEAFHWEMKVIPDTPGNRDNQQLVWMIGGAIATTKVYIKKIAG